MRNQYRINIFRAKPSRARRRRISRGPNPASISRPGASGLDQQGIAPAAAAERGKAHACSGLLQLLVQQAENPPSMYRTVDAAFAGQRPATVVASPTALRWMRYWA
jgi:hypothetical protein